MLLILLLAAAGCSTSSVRTGTALVGQGPGLSGVIGNPNAKVGRDYRFAFPLLKNNSKEPVSITEFRITSLPSGVKVIGYPVYSVNHTSGYQLAYDDSSHEGGPELDKTPNYAGHPYTIKPGVLSDKYAMVHLHVTGKLSAHVKGCEVYYTQDGQSYRQSLKCEFALDMK